MRREHAWSEKDEPLGEDAVARAIIDPVQCLVLWGVLGDVRPGLERLLNEVEVGRRERYVREADRDRFTLGVALTRLAVGRWLGVAPEKVPVSRACDGCGEPHGRPVIEGGPRVSVSHSGDRVALALSEFGGVGVDVEARQRVIKDEVAEILLGAAEAAELGRYGGDRQDALFGYWTRKEAVLKATGDGLRVPLRSLRLSGPEEPPRLVAWEGRPEMPGRITMRTVDPGPGYAAALALIDQPEVTVREEPAGPLLLSVDL
jgi:4'-phosphopantetheinyl transferase